MQPEWVASCMPGSNYRSLSNRAKQKADAPTFQGKPFECGTKTSIIAYGPLLDTGRTGSPDYCEQELLERD